MPELAYVYEPEQVNELHDRALTIFLDLCEVHDIPEVVKPGVYNSVLNMVAQTKAPRLAMPQS